MSTQYTMIQARKDSMENLMIRKHHKASLQTNEEDKLISQAKSDAESFGKLYDLYAPSIYRYILSRTGNIQDAQDITAQTFLKALEMLPQYHHRGFFSAWLFSIARSKYIDHFRRIKRDLKEIPINDMNTEPDFLSKIVNLERETALRDILYSLPEDEQDLLRLRNVGELSFTEIAKIFKKSEDAIKKKYYRLLARLQSQLEEKNE